MYVGLSANSEFLIFWFYLIVTKRLDNLRNVKQNGILERVGKRFYHKKKKKCNNCVTEYNKYKINNVCIF